MRLMVAVLVAALLLTMAPRMAGAAEECATFEATGQAVCGAFLDYWRDHGGLAQQGYPLSAAFNERSTIDGRYYRVQYFERAVFEWHPDQPAGRQVLLSQLGRETLRVRYPQGVPASAAMPYLPGTDLGAGGCEEFAETSQRLCGIFRAYWHQHGELAQQGYPLTPVIVEQSPLDGREYPVQYFERAVFEYHPELPAGEQVLLSQLGRLHLAARHPRGPSVLDSDTLAVGDIAFKANGTLLEWTIPVTNVGQQPLIAVTVTVVFYDAGNQVIDRSLAAAVNIEPGETRALKGISIKGLYYAAYRILTPEVTLPSGP